MTNQEIYNTIFTYWQELYTDETPSLDRCIWRIKESDKIYNYLLIHLAIEAK